MSSSSSSSSRAVRAVPAPAAVATRPAVDAGEYRIDAPAEVARLLGALHDGNVPLRLGIDSHADIDRDSDSDSDEESGDGGTSIGSRLRIVDAQRRLLGFFAAADDMRLPPLLTADRVTVAGLLDGVRLQFDANGLLLVQGADGGCTLRCAWPTRLWRFQRRGGYRVRPPLPRLPPPTSGPHAVLRHPALAGMRLALRVLDLSIGGCALLLPDDGPGIEPGLCIRGVQLQLDTGTRIDVDLLLRHVGSGGPHARGVRLGCEWVELAGAGERALQRWIDQVQRRPLGR